MSKYFADVEQRCCSCDTSTDDLDDPFSKKVQTYHPNQHKESETVSALHKGIHSGCDVVYIYKVYRVI